jgi:myo-inositol-1(or 4)-monophosphatase
MDIQQQIVGVIRAALPEAHILAEESAEPQDALQRADPLWVIDPLDGSMNFNYGLPFFAVSIAYRAEGRYQFGVVYDPCHDELFQAEFGRGAYLNGSPIFADKFGEGQDAYHNARVGTDWPGGVDERRTALYASRILGNEVTQLWTLGSPILSMCYVAAGRLNAYYNLRLQLWDVTAASVILQEAGGTLTDITGGPWLFSEGGYLASNGVVHGAMLRALKPMLEIQQMQQSKNTAAS